MFHGCIHHRFTSINYFLVHLISSFIRGYRIMAHWKFRTEKSAAKFFFLLQSPLQIGSLKKRICLAGYYLKIPLCSNCLLWLKGSQFYRIFRAHLVLLFFSPLFWFSKIQEENWTRVNKNAWWNPSVFKIIHKIVKRFWHQKFIAFIKVKIKARKERNSCKWYLDLHVDTLYICKKKKYKNNKNTKQAINFFGSIQMISQSSWW